MEIETEANVSCATNRGGVFGPESIVANSFFSGRIKTEVEKIIYQKINEQKLGSSQLNDKTFTFSLGFSPDHISIGESIGKHINSNGIQFFVGGAIATVSFDKNSNAIVSVYNETSRNSLFLHGKGPFKWAAENVEREASGKSAPMSTITQTFLHVFALDKSKIFADNPVDLQSLKPKKEIIQDQTRIPQPILKQIKN